MAAATFKKAPELERVAEELIRNEFGELIEASVSIGYLFRSESQGTGERTTIGRCCKQGDVPRAFHGNDYIIWIALPFWERADSDQREALVYHELKHIKVEIDGRGNTKLGIRKHELTTFFSEYEKYGAWSSDLQKITEIANQKQIEMFDNVSAIHGDEDRATV